MQGDSLSINCVDKVTASLVKGIEQLEAALLVHCAHTDVVPLVADAHGSKLDGGDVDASVRPKLSMTAELGLGHGGLLPETHCAQVAE